jgi:hypothetical protein
MIVNFLAIFRYVLILKLGTIKYSVQNGSSLFEMIYQFKDFQLDYLFVQK